MASPAGAPLRLAVLFVLLTTAARAEPGRSDAGPLRDALQVLADLTLIDGTCRGETVNLGVGFRFAAGQGLQVVAILPGGARRMEFESEMRARRASFTGDELCGEIAENYAEALPGSVSFPNAVRQRD